MDLGALHPHDGALEEHVLPTGEVGMESRSHFDQRASSAVEVTSAPVRSQDAREDLENRGLARSIGTDNAKRLAVIDLKRDILNRPEFLMLQLASGLRTDQGLDG